MSTPTPTPSLPSNASVELHTERLRLRPLHDGDAAALLAIYSDPETMRYWSAPPWASIDQAHALIARDGPAMAAGEHLRLAIERRDDGALIGLCTLFNLSAACRRAEVGYVLARPAWGRGLMNEALRALLHHGFTAMNLNRVEADLDPRNRGSAAALERLGFTREGHLRERWIVGDEVSDSWIYGLLRREWEAHTGAHDGHDPR